MREAEAHVVGVQDLKAVDEELRVERGRNIVAVQGCLDGFGSLSVVALTGFENQLAVGEGQAHGGLALGDQRHTLNGLEQRVTVDDGLDRRGFGEKAAHGGVVAVHERGGGAAALGGESDEGRGTGLRFAGQADLNLGTRGHRLGDVLENAGLDQGDLFDRGVGGFPVEFTHGQAVAVGGQQRNRRAVDFDAYARQQGQRVVAGRCDGHLGDSLGQRG